LTFLMPPRLQAIVTEFHEAQERLHRLARTVPEESWAKPPGPDRWSVAECVAHLNLTSAAFVPLLREGLARARRLDGPRPSDYRRDLVGWLLWTATGSPGRFRTRTTVPFVPRAAGARSDLVVEFERLQAEQIACTEQADGLPLGRVAIASAFNPRIRYNLYACLTLLPRHQHRHLWQAEEAWGALQRGVTR
jgi:hypothetical protein